MSADELYLLLSNWFIVKICIFSVIVINWLCGSRIAHRLDERAGMLFEYIVYSTPIFGLFFCVGFLDNSGNVQSYIMLASGCIDIILSVLYTVGTLLVFSISSYERIKYSRR